MSSTTASKDAKKSETKVDETSKALTEAVEEDDEFEEFEPEHWSKAEQEEEPQQWMDNWDDDMDDDFTKNLRDELVKQEQS
jgi:hypothetical protein